METSSAGGRRFVVLAVAAVTLLAWRAQELAPRPGIDPSWHTGMALAFRQRLAAGTELIFTHGPLGFLNQGGLHFTSTGVLAALYALTVQVAVVASLVLVLRRALPAWATVFVAFVAAQAALRVSTPELLVVPMLVAVVALLDRRSPWLARWFVPLAAAATALQFLVKFNAGAAALGVAAVGAWYARPGRWRSAGLLLAAVVAVFGAGWLATGNSLADVPHWFDRSLAVASGYSSGMVLETASAWEDLALPLVFAAVGLAAWGVSRSWDRVPAVAFLLLTAAFVFLLYKHALVRHSTERVVDFIAAGFLLVVVFAPQRRDPRPAWLLGPLILFGAMVGVSGEREFLANQNPVASLRLAVRHTADLAVPSRRDRLVDEARANLRASYRLEGEVLAALVGHTVHVDPWETTVMWAYPELRWRPLPVFQSYSAYTAVLDRDNADVLRSAAGPDRILRENVGGLDGRNPDFETPEANLALLCNFAEIATSRRWQVLGRVPDRCGPPVRVGSVAGRLDSPVEAPAVPGDDLLVARIDGLGTGLVQALQTTVAKASEYHLTTGEGRRFRLIPETVVGPLLMSKAPAAGFSPAFGFDRRIDRFTIHRGLGLGDDRFTVTFFRVPIRPAAPGS